MLMLVLDPYNNADSIIKHITRDYNLKLLGVNELIINRLDNYLKDSINKTILPKDQNGK
jgi:hypothetical protein